MGEIVHIYYCNTGNFSLSDFHYHYLKGKVVIIMQHFFLRKIKTLDSIKELNKIGALV